MGVSQAMRVTEEQRGSLKLEAYTSLLKELLLMQLQQATTMTLDGLHTPQVSLQSLGLIGGQFMKSDSGF